MTARLRSLGITGTIVAFLAAAVMLGPAATPAQAMPSAGTCAMLNSAIDFALANEPWTAIELYLEYLAMGCR